VALVAWRLGFEERPFRPEVEVGGDPCEWLEGDTDVLDYGQINRSGDVYRKQRRRV
jgi:hypothetical protein